MHTRKKGSRAEDIAFKFLKDKKGFTPIDRNYTIRGGEIDLIMKDGEYIVFIEVKSLRPNSKFSIYNTITQKKRRRLKKSILSWLNANDQHSAIWRLDFVAVKTDYKSSDPESIEHFPHLRID